MEAGQVFEKKSRNMQGFPLYQSVLSGRMSSAEYPPNAERKTQRQTTNRTTLAFSSLLDWMNSCFIFAKKVTTAPTTGGRWAMLDAGKLNVVFSGAGECEGRREEPIEPEVDDRVNLRTTGRPSDRRMSSGTNRSRKRYGTLIAWVMFR